MELQEIAILNNFKNFIKKLILNFFIKRGKISKVEYKFYKIIKKMKKNTIQKPFFYIWKHIQNFIIIIKIIKISKGSRTTGYYIKNLNLKDQLKNSIKILMIEKKDINLFLFRLNKNKLSNKKKILANIERNKFNIHNIVV